MSDVNNGAGYAYMGTRGIWKITVPFFQFYCKPKSALKIKKTKKSWVGCSQKTQVGVEVKILSSVIKETWV